MSKGKAGQRGARGKKSFNNPPKRRRTRPYKGGKGVMLDLKKRAQARDVREQQKKMSAEGYTQEGATDEVNAAANLLVTVFREEDINPYAAMGGMAVLLARMAVADESGKEQFLTQMSEVYAEVEKAEKESTS